MPKTEKVDLYKLHKEEYRASRSPALVSIGAAHYLAIVGRGQPGREVFTTKIGALYNVAFTIKMARKFAGRDYAVCKLEGLWWGSKKSHNFLDEPPSQWNWKLLIRVPDFITATDRKTATGALLKKGKSRDVAEVALETVEEGLCVQMLHVGPYAEEPATVAAMKAFIKQKGLTLHGLHHEIYLSDPRRVAPERLRTILRIPVR